MPFTDEQIRQIDATLAKARGNRTQAAVMLGFTSRELNDAIANHDGLKHWDAKEVPPPISETEALKRIEPVNLPDADLALANAILKEDERFAEGISGMALTGDQIALAVAHQHATGLHFKNMVQGMFGGMYSTYLQCISEQKLTRGRLAKIRYELGDVDQYPYGSDIRAQMVAEEKSLATQCRELGKEIINVNEVGTKGAYLLSMVKQGSKKKKPTPKFKNRTEMEVDATP